MKNAQHRKPRIVLIATRLTARFSPLTEKKFCHRINRLARQNFEKHTAHFLHLEDGEIQLVKRKKE